MKYKFFFGICFFEILLLASMTIYQSIVASKTEHDIIALKQIIYNLKLTDVALWTEARYTRNLSQADLFTAFQDFPGAIDHFPSGSILGAPLIKPSTTISFEN